MGSTIVPKLEFNLRFKFILLVINYLFKINSDVKIRLYDQNNLKTMLKLFI